MAKKKIEVVTGKPKVGLAQPVKKSFKPYKPPQPPTGSYDPALDAQLGGAQRGLGDLRQDVATQNLRATNDYGLAQDDINRQAGRTAADLGTARTNATEDYGTQTSALARSYQQLQRRQAEGARHSGVASAGIQLQAAAKRAQNQALDQAPIDTSYNRFLAENTLAGNRNTEDQQLGLGKLDLSYQRDMFDRNLTQLPRAEREGVQFGLDVGKQKAFQAGQAGWAPPGKGQPGGLPKNEGVLANGTSYQDRVEGAFIVRYDQYGRVLSRKPRKGGQLTVTASQAGKGIVGGRA